MAVSVVELCEGRSPSCGREDATSAARHIKGVPVCVILSSRTVHAGHGKSHKGVMIIVLGRGCLDEPLASTQTPVDKGIKGQRGRVIEETQSSFELALVVGG